MERTVGFELEMSDVDRSKVMVPTGYSWSKEETLYGSNGKAQTASSKFGGELNTRPFKMCFSDRDELKQVFKSMLDAGGHVMWCNYFHVHVWVGDFDLEGLKRLFLLSYYTNQYIKEFCDVKPYREFNLCCPTPTLEYVQKCRNASSFEELQNVFKNSSNKGYIRHLVNINAYWKIKTVEFRVFASTENFDEIVASVFFAQRFVKYAKEHTEEEFAQIRSMDDFKRKLKIHMPVSKVLPHMINAGDQTKEAERFISKPLKYSSPLVKLLLANCGEELCCVNPNIYSLEIALFPNLKRLSVYNTCEFNDVLYRIAKGELIINYRDKFEFLQSHKDGTQAMEMVCFFVFHNARRFTSDTEYDKKNLDAIVEGMQKSKEKLGVTATKLVTMLNSIEYHLGTLNDALYNENNIFFEFDGFSKLNSTCSFLKKYTDYESERVEYTTNYLGVVENLREGQTLYLASRDQYLSLNRLGSVNGTILYSTKSCEKPKVISQYEQMVALGFKIAPDDLDICDPKKLVISEAVGKQFTTLQHTYVKKVASFMGARFQYIVYYDGYVLGAFAFDFPKLNYDMWLLSDFTVNNKIRRLAKLILLCIKSDIVKKMLQRKCYRVLDTIYTKVYTSNPVSMKYRGPFKKVHVEGVTNALVYTSTFGSSGSMEDVIRQYLKMRDK